MLKGNGVVIMNILCELSLTPIHCPFVIGKGNFRFSVLCVGDFIAGERLTTVVMKGI